MIDKRLGLAVLAKLTTKLALIETQDEQIRVSSIFCAVKNSLHSKSPVHEIEDSKEDAFFRELEKLNSVFSLSRMDDGFRFNQELQELTSEFNSFFIEVVDQGLHEFEDVQYQVLQGTQTPETITIPAQGRD